MGRTACTEPQCLYTGALYLYLYRYPHIKYDEMRPFGGAELFHAERRTDMTKPILAFRNFANASKKDISKRNYGICGLA